MVKCQGDKSLNRQVQFGPKSPAGGRLYNSNALLLKAQQSGHVLAIVVGILGADLNDQAPFFIDGTATCVGQLPAGLAALYCNWEKLPNAG